MTVSTRARVGQPLLENSTSTSQPRLGGALCALALSLFVAACGQPDGIAGTPTESHASALYANGSVKYWTGGVVNVCYDPTTGNLPGLLAQARTILANSWSRVAKISFVGWGPCDPTKATETLIVQFAPGTPGTTVPWLGEPQPAPGSPPGSYFNVVVLVSDDLPPYAHFNYEVLHEFGHALGFDHEQDRPENFLNPGSWQGNPYCGSHAANDVEDMSGVALTAYYDEASIMNYCAGWANVLSDGDGEGARRAYGNHTLVTPGDFNGDGITDFIVTTASGSQWFYSQVNGSISYQLGYSRPDLPLNSVSFTTGDFNNDGRTDVIITTAFGSYWYIASSAGPPSWNSSYYNRTDLTRGHVELTVGDFNGDNYSDVIVTTAAGSDFLYTTATGPRSFYTQPTWILGQVAYKIANFDGVRGDDMIVTNYTGSYWFYAAGVGVFNNVGVRGDLPLGQVGFTVGDFDGNGKSDMIVATPSGSTWYYSLGTGQWSPTTYARPDLPLANVAYTTGDFDGDGKMTDVIITTASGSYWYISLGLAAFNSGVLNTRSLPLGSALMSGVRLNQDKYADLLLLVPNETVGWYSTGLGAGSYTPGTMFNVGL